MLPFLARLAALIACLLVPGSALAATTPIKHLVVIYPENVAFDHYFGTYPNALNPAGEPAFTAKPGTPTVNGLSGALLTANPNSVNPFRFSRAQALTCGNNHSYSAEQQAYNGGLMNKFVEFTSCGTNNTMGYYDGNTVTAMWNYAQNYTLSDAYFSSVFGPSLPGHINLVSGQTGGATPEIPGVVVNGTLIGGAPAAGDECGNRNPAGNPTFGAAPNIGTLLSAKGVSWGYFQGGFRPTGSDAGGALCDAAHANAGGNTVRDYVAHHEPFQYYDATANPTHQAPATTADIGHDDPGAKVNHQYDMIDFNAALAAGNVPEVTFLKPPGYQDAHAGYSTPIDEQRYVVETVNAIQASPIWPDTAIVIAYDDTDGWYDHVFSPIVNSSHDATYDKLDGAGQCHGPAPSPPVAGGVDLRCGYGPRMPLLVISPYARVNNVNHTVVDQGSILRFIEDNWATGRLGNNSFDDIPAGKPSIAGLFDFSAGAARAGKLVLDPATGNPPPPATTPTPVPPTTSPPVAKVAAVKLTASVKPKRDRRRPYVYRVRGTLVPPTTVARASACTGQVSVSVVAKRRVVVTRRASLTADCRYSRRIRFATKRKLGRTGRLTFRTTFLGNDALLSRKAPAVKARAG
jgi:phospholipase C